MVLERIELVTHSFKVTRVLVIRKNNKLYFD